MYFYLRAAGVNRAELIMQYLCSSRRLNPPKARKCSLITLAELTALVLLAAVRAYMGCVIFLINFFMGHVWCAYSPERAKLQILCRGNIYLARDFSESKSCGGIVRQF